MNAAQQVKWTLAIDASQANQTHKTGVPLYAYALIQELKRIIPADVRVILYSPTPLQGALAKLPSHWQSRVLRWPVRKFWSQWRLGWELVWRRPDLLFVPTHILPWCGPVNAVFAVYDIGFEYAGIYGTSDAQYSRHAVLRRLLAAAINIGTKGKYGLSEQDYHRWTIRHALSKAAAIVTISEFTRQEMLAVYGLPQERVQVLHDAFDVSPFLQPVTQEQQDRACARLGIVRPFLFYIGRLETKKNIKRLLEAFYILKTRFELPHQLVLAGMPGNGYPEIAQTRRARNLDKDVVETGWIADEDAFALMHAADLFVFPSLYEGFGIPLLQAQAAATPLACSDMAVLRETAGAGAAFFDPKDPDHIAEVIYNMLHNQRLRQDCIRAGGENLKRFEWHRSAVEIWETMRQAAEARVQRI